MKPIAPSALAALLDSAGEWALFDIREAGEADRGHVFGATFLPRRLIEARIADLVGHPATTIVVYDEGGARAARAAATLERLGYADVRFLEGGTAAWVAEGRRLTSGSNVPSKLFGEEVYEHEHVPQLPVATLKRWQDEGRPHVVCDIRTPDEYAVARIPGAHGAFGVDLALVAGDLASQDVPIVVHCAGRTRSIIACQSLRALGAKSVYALENGTMGWLVAGYELERGEPRGVLKPSAASAQQGEADARRLALEAGATEIDVAAMAALLAERAAGRSNTYVFDVRQVADYTAGHVPGAAALPGGLAVQRTDEFAPVRAARIVLVDEHAGRAHLTAYWLRKQGRPNVQVLAGGLAAWRAAGNAVETGRQRRKPLGIDAARAGVHSISALELQAAAGATVVHVDTSRDYAEARVPGARWIPFGWLEERVSDLTATAAAPLVLTCGSGSLSTFAAANLLRLGVPNVRVLEGGVKAWQKAGLAVDRGWPADQAPADDLVVPPYNSSLESMARYLAWEQKLTAERRAGGSA